MYNYSIHQADPPSFCHCCICMATFLGLNNYTYHVQDGEEEAACMEGNGEEGRVPEGDMGPCLVVAEDHGSHEEDVVGEGLSNL